MATVAELELEQKLAATEDPKQKVWVLVDLCNLFGFEEAKRAYVYAERMLAVAEEMQDAYWIARALYACAKFQYRTGENSDTLPLAEKAVQILQELNEKELLHKVLHHIAIVSVEKGDYAKALLMATKNADYWREVNNEVELLRPLQMMSEAYRQMGEYAKSLETADEMLMIATAQNLPREVYRVYGFLAVVHGDMGEYEKSIGYHLKELEFLEKAEKPDSLLLGVLNHHTGLSYCDLGQLEEAERYFLAARKYFSAIGHVFQEAGVLDSLGMVYKQRGKLDAALAYLKQAESTLEAGLLDRVSYTEGLYADMAEVYKAMGDTPSEMLYLKKALDCVQKSGVRKLEYELCLELSDACERVGDTASAYEYHKRYTAIKEDVLNAEKQKAIAAMQAMFDVKKAGYEKEVFRLRNVELRTAMEEVSRLSTSLAALNEEKNKLLQLVTRGLKSPLLGMSIAPE